MRPEVRAFMLSIALHAGLLSVLAAMAIAPHGTIEVPPMPLEVLLIGPWDEPSFGRGGESPLSSIGSGKQSPVRLMPAQQGSGGPRAHAKAQPTTEREPENLASPTQPPVGALLVQQEVPLPMPSMVEPHGIGGREGSEMEGRGGDQPPATSAHAAGFGPGGFGQGPGGRGTGGTLAPPRYGANPKPVYPQLARLRGEEGTVVLEVYVLATGRVGEVRLRRSSGYDALDASARETVRKWRFVPAKQGEKPVEAWVSIPIRFRLEQ